MQYSTEAESRYTDGNRKVSFIDGNFIYQGREGAIKQQTIFKDTQDGPFMFWRASLGLGTLSVVLVMMICLLCKLLLNIQPKLCVIPGLEFTNPPPPPSTPHLPAALSHSARFCGYKTYSDSLHTAQSHVLASWVPP